MNKSDKKNKGNKKGLYVGSVKAKTSMDAIKKARKKYPGIGVTVKLYYTDSPLNMYNVFKS